MFCFSFTFPFSFTFFLSDSTIFNHFNVHKVCTCLYLIIQLAITCMHLRRNNASMSKNDERYTHIHTLTFIHKLHFKCHNKHEQYITCITSNARLVFLSLPGEQKLCIVKVVGMQTFCIIYTCLKQKLFDLFSFICAIIFPQ